MYSLRYGTVPIVRATGGLDDTVVDARENAELADGIKFHEYSGRALAKAIRKGLALYEAKEALQQFRVNSMKADFSWSRTASQFAQIYQQAVRKS